MKEIKRKTLYATGQIDPAKFSVPHIIQVFDDEERAVKHALYLKKILPYQKFVIITIDDVGNILNIADIEDLLHYA